MNVLIVLNGKIPVTLYGGTERIAWYLGKELAKMGHQITFLVKKGSTCNFAKVLFIDQNKDIEDQIPNDVDIVHFNITPTRIEKIKKPFVVTIHGKTNNPNAYFDKNTIFVSKSQAAHFGSQSYVYNGLDWDDYKKPNFSKKNYFHFLGKAQWKLKNLKGAIEVIEKTKNERLKVLGGYRIGFKMGFRFTWNTRVSFKGYVGGNKKCDLLNASKGLIFPVLWYEPFGLAITESLYYGCPVFGTTHGSLKELIKPDVGFLSNSASELANAIENQNFSYKTCHEYALEEFNSRKMAELYYAKYLQVLNNVPLHSENPKLSHIQPKRFLEWLD